MIKNSLFGVFFLLYFAINFWVDGRIGFYRLFFWFMSAVLLGWIFKVKYGEKIAWSMGLLVIFFLHWNLFSWPTLSGPDAQGFWNLAHGANPSMELALFRPKLYPFLLKLLPSLGAAGLFQLALKLGMLICFFLCGLLLEWKKETILFSILIFSSNSLWLREPFLISDTTLFSFMILSALVCSIWYLKSNNILSLMLFSLFAGLASLTRQILDPILILSLIFLAGYRFNPIKILSLGLFLSVIGLSALSNYAKFGIAKRSVALGINLYTHSSFYSLQINPAESQIFLKDCPDFPYKIPLSWSTHYKSYISTKANALPHHYQLCLESKGMKRIESDAYLTREFFNWVKNNFGFYLYSAFNEFRRLFFSSGEYYPPKIFLEDKSRFPGSEELKRLERQVSYLPVWWLLATLLTLIAAVKTVKFRWLAPSLLGMSLCYFIMISAIQIGFTRYTLPILPLLLIAICHKIDGISFKKTFCLAVLSSRNPKK